MKKAAYKRTRDGMVVKVLRTDEIGGLTEILPAYKGDSVWVNSDHLTEAGDPHPWTWGQSAAWFLIALLTGILCGNLLYDLVDMGLEPWRAAGIGFTLYPAWLVMIGMLSGLLKS